MSYDPFDKNFGGAADREKIEKTNSRAGCLTGILYLLAEVIIIILIEVIGPMIFENDGAGQLSKVLLFMLGMHIIGLGIVTFIVHKFVPKQRCPFCGKLYRTETIRTLVDTQQTYKTITRKDSHSGSIYNSSTPGVNHYGGNTYRDEQVVVDRKIYEAVTRCAHCDAVYSRERENEDTVL
jgi:uncharacterized C2H2 Zn-finger protein